MPPATRSTCNNRGKAVILAVIGTDGCQNGVRIAASHIDSPRLDLKPHPLYEKDDLALFKTHYYGGIKKYQWTTIPLSMHGRIILKDGTRVDVNIGEHEGEPQFCVTDLLPHLADEQMKKTLSKGVEGENLNILIGSRPLRTDEGDNLVKLNVMKILNEKYGMTEEDFVSADIEFVPAFRPVDVGFDRSMIGAYGHDDRVCAYPALTASAERKEAEADDCYRSCRPRRNRQRTAIPALTRNSCTISSPTLHRRKVLSRATFSAFPNAFPPT